MKHYRRVAKDIKVLQILILYDYLLINEFLQFFRLYFVEGKID